MSQLPTEKSGFQKTKRKERRQTREKKGGCGP